MDRKMMNLGRAKKQLRYFQTEEKTSCSLKIKEVFSLNDLDNIFDDLDSGSDSAMPQLSLLPRSDEIVEQGKEDNSLDLKISSPFGAEEPEVLAPENPVQEDHLIGKESPFKEIAPIRTSSPIDLLPAGNGAEDAERPETSPILFGVEDEEPVRRDLSKPLTNQRSPQEFLQEDSESLVSPPARLEFGKPATQDVVSVTGCMPVQSPDATSRGCQTSAPEAKEESRKDGSPSLLPPVLAQNSRPAPLPKEQPKNQVPEVKLDVEVKESSFQQKLRHAFKPKTLWKQEAWKPQTHALSPLELEDDFMILEDDAPILFTIPRKANSSQKEKHAPEGVSAKPDDKKTASQAESAAPKLGDEPDAAKTKKSKAKRGNTYNKGDKDTMTQATVEERNDPLTEVEEVVEVCEPSSVPEANQDADLPDTGKQRRNSKTSIRFGKKDGKNNNQAKIPVEKPASKRKKPAKVTGDTNNGQEEHTSNEKKKPNKAKSTVKGSAKSDQQINDNATLTDKQVPKVQEQVDKLHKTTEPHLEPTEQPDVQITVPVKKAAKQPATKQGTSKRVKKVQKTKEDAKVKELPVPESDISAEGSVTGKRKRKPPGEWWLTSDIQNEGNTQVQEVAGQESLQELKSNKKMKRKEAPAISTQRTEEQESQSMPIKHVTVQKVGKKVKKSNSTSDQRNPKVAGDTQKTKSAAPTQRQIQSKTPAPLVGEEAAVHEDVEQVSSKACSPPRRQTLTPGEKRVFDKIYTRDGQCGSAQKHPPSALHRPESLTVKRQRKPPSNWWEVPQSQGSVESSLSPPNCSPKAQTALPRSAFDKAANVVSSRKTMVRAQKKNKINMIHTPKSAKRSLATFEAILASGKPESSTVRGFESRQKGRRNLLHSLEDQSEQSSENIHSDHQHGSSHATFDVCPNGATMDSFAARKKADARLSAGSNRASSGIGFKSGPSSMIELERFEETEDSVLPSSRMVPCIRHVPRVLSDCDLCGPPLRPIVLEAEDWDNLCVWFAHLWPSSSKEGNVFSVISPDDFHWHSHGGRAMGHMVDLQNNTFSNGKILLGSYMKKPPQADLHAVTVFNVLSSCVRVEIDGVKTVYNSGQTFMTPCGKSYSIHNICREPAVLWYHRMLTNDT
ncbi:microtubule-associated protein futsch [Colossoma macropomum]|uniref:microtubule-associated protein futsch n=1 Tax=Colossoma macropomum TaxID=42526 RepID=UPI001863B124|nr:microtubule-associated protein futsch [Colossoma macropomum]